VRYIEAKNFYNGKSVKSCLLGCCTSNAVRMSNSCPFIVSNPCLILSYGHGILKVIGKHQPPIAAPHLQLHSPCSTASSAKKKRPPPLSQYVPRTDRVSRSFHLPCVLDGKWLLGFLQSHLSKMILFAHIRHLVPACNRASSPDQPFTTIPYISKQQQFSR
jgi:hypothetical protein